MASTNQSNSNSVNKTLKIGSINIWGLSNRSNFCLNKYVEEENLDILTVQELKGPTGELNPDNLVLDNMSYITDTNNAANKGTAIYVNNNFSLTKLDTISKLSKNIDTCWGLVVAQGKRIIIGCAYVKLNYEPGIAEVLNMLKEAERMKDQLKAYGIVLTGDFNSRHISWGDSITGSYGKKLFESLDHTAYSICTSKTPTFLCHTGGSYIDLMIVSNRLADNLKNCVTNTEVELYSGAPTQGHVPLIAELIIDGTQNKNIKQKLDLTTMKWEEWTAHIEMSINEIANWETEDDAHRLWNILNAIITEATDKHCLSKKCCMHSKPFWTKSLSVLSINLKKARKSYVKRNTPRNLEILKTAKEEFDQERKAACKEFLINKVKNLNSVQAQHFWREFNKMFNKKSIQRIDPLNDGKGGLLTDQKDMENCLFSIFFEGKHLENQAFDNNFYEEVCNLYDMIIEDDDYLQHSQESPANSDELNAEITIEEITKSLKSNGKSVDNFNFHPKMLKNLGPKAIKLLHKIFNLCFASHQWVWDGAEVVFLRKDGKDSYANPGSYRPICNTSYIGKRLESIIAKRIEAWLLKWEKDDEDQEGFSKHKNTIRYLSRLHHGIECDKENNLTVLCLFIDFEKAFDSVWKRGLIVKLHKLGIRGNILKLINSFLFCRKVTLNVNGTKGNERNGSEYGLPQGSVLSPVLFKIYLMDFLSELNNQDNISILKFADDGTIKISAETSPNCVDKLNLVLKCLETWTSKWRLKVNCDKNKTEVICFNTSENDKDLIPDSFSLGDKQICKVSSTKVLGLTIDENLSYKQHCTNLLKSIQTTWANLCKYSNRHWGFTQEVMLYLVITLIISKISYASHIYATRTNMQEINSFWYHILKSITGAVFNIKQNLAEVILGVPPLLIQSRVNSIKHYLKLNLKPLKRDRYRDFIISTYDQSTKSPSSLHTRLKYLFDFLQWKVARYPTHFNQEDTNIIELKLFEQFFSLSEKACAYDKKMINHYTENMLWTPSLINQYQFEGLSDTPKPSCDRIAIPKFTPRKTEVLLMSIFYKNNLLKSFLYNIGRSESPLCTQCGLSEETADHLLFTCASVPESLRTRCLESYINATKNDSNIPLEIQTGFLNASRNPEFMSSCIEVLKDLPLDDSIIL